jgi:hypothetical protein
MLPRWLAQIFHPPQMFENPTIAILKKFRPRKLLFQKKNLVGMSTIFHCTKLCFSKCNCPWVVATQQKVILNINRPPCLYFSYFHKNGFIKSCSSSEHLTEYSISWFFVDWCNFCIHLKSQNVRHFGMFAAMASKSPSMEWSPYWIFLNIYQLVQKLIGVKNTDRSAISLA